MLPQYTFVRSKPMRKTDWLWQINESLDQALNGQTASPPLAEIEEIDEEIPVK